MSLQSHSIDLAPAVVAELESKVRRETRQAVSEAAEYADKLVRELIDRTLAETQDRINSAITPQTLFVQIDDAKLQKLKNPSGPALKPLLTNAKLGINTLLVGPAGCGKSMAASQLAEAMGLRFGHLCLTAGASETWLFGRQTPTGFREGVFSDFYRNGGVFLGDELDAADANMLLSINTAIAGQYLYNPISGETIQRHKDFVFVGAANTLGKGSDEQYTGRARLDAATLDRFAVVMMDYDASIERNACPDTKIREAIRSMRRHVAKVGAKEILSTRAMSRAYLLKSSGQTYAEVFSTVLITWPEELREQVKGMIPVEDKPNETTG